MLWCVDGGRKQASPLKYNGVLLGVKKKIINSKYTPFGPYLTRGNFKKLYLEFIRAGINSK